MKQLLLLNPNNLIADWEKNPRPRNNASIYKIAWHMNTDGYREDRPIIAFLIDGVYHVGAGFHRREAALTNDPDFPNLPLSQVWVEVREGTWDDLAECMLIDNFRHDPEVNSDIGFALTNTELRTARIKLMLLPKYFKMADSALVALNIGKSTTLRRLRKELIAALSDEKDATLNISDDRRQELLDIVESGKRIGADGREIDITSIGKNSAPKNWEDVEILLEKTGYQRQYGDVDVLPTDIEKAACVVYNVDNVKQLPSQQCQLLIDMINDAGFMESDFSSHILSERDERIQTHISQIQDTYQTQRNLLRDMFHNTPLSQEIDLTVFFVQLHEYAVLDIHDREILIKIYQNVDYKDSDIPILEKAIQCLQRVIELIENNIKVVQTIQQKYVDKRKRDELKQEISDHLLKEPTNFCQTHNVTTNDAMNAIIHIFADGSNYDNVSLDDLASLRDDFTQGHTQYLVDESIRIREERIQEEQEADETRTRMHRREADTLLEAHWEKFQFHGYGDSYEAVQEVVYNYATQKFGVESVDTLRYGQWIELRNELKEVISSHPYNSELVRQSPRHALLDQIGDKNSAFIHATEDIVERDKLTLTGQDIETYIFKTLTEKTPIFRQSAQSDATCQELQEYLEVYTQIDTVIDNWYHDDGLGKEIELLGDVSKRYGGSIKAVLRFGYPEPLLSTVKSIVKLLSHAEGDYEYIGDTPQSIRMEQYQQWFDEYDTIVEKSVKVKLNDWAVAYRETDEALDTALPILEEHGLPEMLITEIYKEQRIDISNRVALTTDDLNTIRDDMNAVIDNPKWTDQWTVKFRKAIDDQPIQEVITTITIIRPNNEPIQLPITIPEHATDADIEAALYHAISIFENQFDMEMEDEDDDIEDAEDDVEDDISMEIGDDFVNVDDDFDLQALKDLIS